MITTLPAGKYYIGDPCYAFDDSWGDVLKETDFFYAEPCTIGTSRLAAGSTAYGDGEYYDQENTAYPVDAGLIGALPINLLKRDGKLNPKKIKEDNLGRVVEFKEPFMVEINNGFFRFGHIEIDTRYDSNKNDD